MSDFCRAERIQKNETAVGHESCGIWMFYLIGVLGSWVHQMDALIY
jgi:hypothetical protein